MTHETKTTQIPVDFQASREAGEVAVHMQRAESEVQAEALRLKIGDDLSKLGIGKSTIQSQEGTVSTFGTVQDVAPEQVTPQMFNHAINTPYRR